MMKQAALAALILAAPAAPIIAAPAARAQGVIAEWARVPIPPPPALSRVGVDPAHTALLLLDFVSETCSETRRPRCLATIPAIAALLARARAHHATIIYSDVIGGSAAEINPGLARRPGEPVVQSGPDKFLNTDLDAILRARHVTAVIVTGTAAEGAVLATASEAAYRGYQVIVPVDAMSSATLYPEQYVAWDLLHAPVLAFRTRLTASRLIGFGEANRRP